MVELVEPTVGSVVLIDGRAWQSCRMDPRGEGVGVFWQHAGSSQAITWDEVVVWAVEVGSAVRVLFIAEVQ